MAINAEVNDLVKALVTTGPEVGLLSRQLNVYKETVRYRYKRFILGNHMSVHADVDFGKLGLSRAVAVIAIPAELSAAPRDFLMKIAEKNFMVGFEKVLTRNRWVVAFNYPKGSFAELALGLRELKESGVFYDYDLYNLERFHVEPMHAEYFDFVHNRWDFDWSSLHGTTNPLSFTSGTSSFDSLDLKIIEKLQEKADTHLVDFALPDVNYKTLSWHYREHVLGKKLVTGYWVNWLGTNWVDITNTAMSRPHVFLRVDLFAHDISESEIALLSSQAHTTPFLWSESAGPDYVAKFGFPVDTTPEALKYLDRMIQSVDGKAKMAFMDQTTAVSYTILPNLFDSQSGAWMFHPEVGVAALKKLMPQARVSCRTRI